MAQDVAQLIADLGSPDAAVRLAAAEKLGQLGEDGAAAAVALVHRLTDNETIREAAAGALEGIGPPLANQLTELSQLVQDRSSDVVYWSATLIGRLEAAGAAATASLAQALDKSADAAARERAAWALGEIGPAAQSALDSLQKAAASGAPRLTRLAQQAIDRIRGK